VPDAFQLDETGKASVGLAGGSLGLGRPLVSSGLIASTARKRSPSTKRPYHRAPLARHQHLHVPRAGARPGTLAVSPPRKMFQGSARRLHTLRGEGRSSWLSPREVTSPSAPSNFSRPRRAAPPCAGRPRCRAGEERNARTPVVWVVTGRQGSPSARPPTAETLDAIRVSGLIGKLIFCVVCFFTQARGKKTRGRRGRSLSAFERRGNSLGGSGPVHPDF